MILVIIFAIGFILSTIIYLKTFRAVSAEPASLTNIKKIPQITNIVIVKAIEIK